MSHLDRTFNDDQSLLKFARMGCLLEYDLFGIECSHYQVLALSIFVLRLKMPTFSWLELIKHNYR